ncbi:MAG: branched-chain amino acid transaminase [Candidatus Spechtbacteria bacterium]|nr:branched-chain amino acid transaminase [Candidatus Spechtbacteria bacterium]
MALSQIAWMDGKIIPLEEAAINIFSPTVQYGHGGFEGIRFYETGAGPAVFRIQEHWERFFSHTAQELAMEIPYSADDLTAAVIGLIRATGMREGYIRPTIVYPEPELGLRFQQKKVSVAIVLSSWEKKLAQDSLAVKISPVMRNHPDAVNMRAKVTGYYQNPIRALRDASQDGFDEAILLDSEGNVVEGSAENIFLVQKLWTGTKALFTPRKGAILPGITRGTVMALARAEGYIVNDCTSFKASNLFLSDEIFLCGTAMEILAVTAIDGNMIGNGKTGEVTSHISQLYSDVIHGRDERYLHWLTLVNS